MSLSNPVGDALANATAYRDAILALLGGDDPLAVLAATPAALGAAVAGLDAPQMARPERPGKWSIAGVVQHFADSEIAHGWRLRLVLAEERPALPSFDQDGWAASTRYDTRDVPLAIEAFSALRALHVDLYRRLEPAQWERIGVHSERGEESVRLIARLYAGHDRAHLNQIARIRNAHGLPAAGVQVK